MRDFCLTFKIVPLFCDNTSAIRLAKNLCFYGKVKHIEVKHHFLRDNVEKGEIVIRRVETEKQLVDIFTNRLMLSVLLPFLVSLAFASPMACFKGESVFLVQSLLFCFYFILYHVISYIHP